MGVDDNTTTCKFMSQISNKMKQTLPQIGWILCFWLVGEVLSRGLDLPLPGSIIGMILLTLSLEFKMIKVSEVENVSDFLIRNMAFFFVPPGVGLMVNLDLIADNWVPIVIATFVSTVLVFIVTGLVAQLGTSKNKKTE